jgi:hypothetical protein
MGIEVPPLFTGARVVPVECVPFTSVPASIPLSGLVDSEYDPISVCGIFAWQLGHVPSAFGKTRVLQLGHRVRFIFCTLFQSL